MKKIIYALFAVIPLIWLSGCTDFSDDIKNLQAQIDALKSDQIKSIDDQISSIKSSLASLQLTDKELQFYITQLQSQRESLEATDKSLSSQIESLKKDVDSDIKDYLSQLGEYKALVSAQIATLTSTIETLQKKDSELLTQIEKLQDYADSGIKGAKDWVSATFATLEQYNATASIVASLQTQVETIHSDLSLLKNITDKVSKDELEKAIASSEAGIKEWVNSLLEGYYTAEQTDAKLSALKEELSRTGSSEMESLVKDYESKLSKAKSEITEAYTAAITKAINDYNGTITSRIASEIATVNTKISTLRSDLTALETKVAAIDKRLAALEKLVNDMTNSGDGSNRRIKGETTLIGDIEWMNYNVGADESNVLGEKFTYEEAKTVCPEGYRLPSVQEFGALTYTHPNCIPDTARVYYNTVKGSWYSGELPFTLDNPAVFLPDYYYWTSTESRYLYTHMEKCNPYVYISDKGNGWVLEEDDEYNRRKYPDYFKDTHYVRCIRGGSTSYREITEGTTVIDGIEWLNFDSATECNWMNSQLACPDGYRTPSLNELKSLYANTSEATYVSNCSGVWCSGQQPYSETAPAVFFSYVIIWSSTMGEVDSYGNFTAYAYINYEDHEPGVTSSGCPASIRCVKDNNPRKITGESTVIDGLEWLNYNVGADADNLTGSVLTFDEAQTACPDGYRVPTADELKSLSAHCSPFTKYNGVIGIWLTGSNQYSSDSPETPAIFLPQTSSDSMEGSYWSATDCGYGSTKAHFLVFNEERLYISNNRYYDWDSMDKSATLSVRCVKQ